MKFINLASFSREVVEDKSDVALRLMMGLTVLKPFDDVVDEEDAQEYLEMLFTYTEEEEDRPMSIDEVRAQFARIPGRVAKADLLLTRFPFLRDMSGLVLNMWHASQLLFDRDMMFVLSAHCPYLLRVGMPSMWLSIVTT